jgi:hypothetical protein
MAGVTDRTGPHKATKPATKPEKPWENKFDRQRHGWRKILFGEPVSAILSVRVYRPRKPPKPKSEYSESFKMTDKGRRYASIKACRLHLRDLATVYGYDRISPGVGPITPEDIMGDGRWP